MIIIIDNTCELLQVSSGISKPAVSAVCSRLIHRDGEKLWTTVHCWDLMAAAPREERHLRPAVPDSHHDGTHVV